MTRPLIATTGAVLDTATGGKGHKRTPKGELFLAAVSSFASPGSPDSERVRALTGQVALDDPSWVLRFDRWLRDEGNVRTTTIEVACAFVHSRLEAGIKDETGPGPATGLNRTAINVACLRADEPAKLIEYWRATYGRKLPMPVKRGVADAVVRLYDEWSAIKYDGSGHEMRMGDVIELVHPKAKSPAQGALFEYLINRRHGWKDSTYLFPHLPMVAENERLRRMDKAVLRELLLDDPLLLKGAGWTWENLSSLGPMDKAAWTAMIPTMGYMALLRNLRNFDNAGISASTAELVTSRLSDRGRVHKSRQFPFRFLSAFKNASARWHPALDQALTHSLENVPELKGHTLVMVDCSGSMDSPASEKSEMSRREMAALFGVALQARCESSKLVQYGDPVKDGDPLWEEVVPDGGVLNTVYGKFRNMGGTKTAATLRELLKLDPTYDRVVILTDEQANASDYDWRSHTWTRVSVSDVIPEDVMLYTWNLGGLEAAHAESSPTSHTFGGLTDQCFKLIPLIESGTTTDWPF